VSSEEILAEPIEIVDGTVTARGPGLGLEWNEAAVAKDPV
jgi:mandelate racemase